MPDHPARQTIVEFVGQPAENARLGGLIEDQGTYEPYSEVLAEDDRSGQDAGLAACVVGDFGSAVGPEDGDGSANAAGIENGSGARAALADDVSTSDAVAPARAGAGTERTDV